ncbi:hypothetical protein HDU76_011221 [Blyttiomyces sp. JEL0837]|nr:hypothetical protein HDU76_011221 [Blyttiomyces sp. JEL0837]
MLTPLLAYFWITSSLNIDSINKSSTQENAKPQQQPAWAPFQGHLKWDEIRSIVANGEFEKFSRTAEVTASYGEWRVKVAQEFVSIPDYIKIEVLGFPFEMAPDGDGKGNGNGKGKLRAVGDFSTPGLKDRNQTFHVLHLGKETRYPHIDEDEDQGVLRPNDFPYATDASQQIQHMVLWSIGEHELDPAEVEAILRSKIPGHEFIYFINPPHRKTIPEINHYHVFSRPLTLTS